MGRITGIPAGRVGYIMVAIFANGLGTGTGKQSGTQSGTCTGRPDRVAEMLDPHTPNGNGKTYLFITYF